MSARLARRLLAGLLLASLASSCAYYNTFYLAKKYYDTGTNHMPYLVDKPVSVDQASFNKSIDYSKKVIAQYAKSKWVDDAYLLWARALLGKDDPLQTINMLQTFTDRYPKSSIAPEARFYLGVAYLHARKYREGELELAEFLKRAPKHNLVEYALLERSRALYQLKRYDEAERAAATIIEHHLHTRLLTEAQNSKADALFAMGEFARARVGYHVLGESAETDEDRLAYLFREADCLEGMQAWDTELALLRGAQSHEAPPPPPAPPGQVSNAPPPTNDRYGRMMVRIGTALLLKGKLDDGLTAYRSVVEDYPRTPLAAEAQYRIGYAYETTADDFDKARDEYAKVKDIAANSAFVDQARQRQQNLDRLATFRKAGKDSLETRAEAGFLLAEQYLFQINKPDRALEEYQKIATDMAGTPYEAKALMAQAWVLSRKLDRKSEADSLFWVVVRQHPATEAQLASRDYLEMEGNEVPQDLIQLPKQTLAQSQEPAPALSPVPGTTTPLGSQASHSAAPGVVTPPAMLMGGAGPGGMPNEAPLLPPVAPAATAGTALGPPMPDSSGGVVAPDTSRGGMAGTAPDTSHVRQGVMPPPAQPASRDTTRKP